MYLSFTYYYCYFHESGFHAYSTSVPESVCGCMEHVKQIFIAIYLLQQCIFDIKCDILCCSRKWHQSLANKANILGCSIMWLKPPTCATSILWMEVCGSLVLPVSTVSPCTTRLDVAEFPAWFWRPGLDRSSEEGWFRIADTHSSTWKCKKLFQEYLKNRSYEREIQSKLSDMV